MEEIVAGTYEGFLLGYAVQTQNKITKLEQTFATHSHISSIRCVDSSSKYFASGGTDDKIVITDLNLRKEHTVLMNQNGTINSVAFTKSGTHLLSASEDGSLFIYRVGSWQVEKKWAKAHNGSPVVAVAVHPSDKLALTLGGDKTLRTWNLVKGRPAFTINLASKGITCANEIVWSPEGSRFITLSQQTVDIWSTEKAGIEKSIKCNSKPTCVLWLNKKKIIIGLENGNIIFINNLKDIQANTIKAHNQRIKCIMYRNSSLYTASSGGELKVWSFNENNSLIEKAYASCGCRITCVTLNTQELNVKTENSIAVELKLESENVSGSDMSDQETVPKKLTATKRPQSYISISYDNESEVEQKSSPKTKIKKINKRVKGKSSKRTKTLQ